MHQLIVCDQRRMSETNFDTGVLVELAATKDDVRSELGVLEQKLKEIESREHQLKEEYHRQEYTNYKINPSTMEKIQGIVNDVKRYVTWEQFVDESLKNTITMWREPNKMIEIGAELWNDLTQEMKDEIKDKVPEYYYSMDQQFGTHDKIATMKKEIKVVKAKLFKHKFPVPKNTVLGFYSEKSGAMYPYIHETYNRFFPLKLLVTTLASMIHKTINVPGHTEWVGYEEFSKEALEFAQEISNKLKKIKSTAGRNERISTGLPIGYPHQKDPDKIKTSDVRFLKCFVGHKGATQVFAEKQIHRGALNETGLVYIREKNKKLEITLSKEGFEFYKMKNPIIDGIHDINKDNGSFKFKTNDEDHVESKAFSNEEKNFIMKNIIAKFPLEDKIVKGIVSDMSNGKEKNHHEIDDIITKKTGNGDEYDKLSKEVQDKIKAYRMATMGRLAEIGVVNWEIRKGNSGNAESFYSINTK